MKYIIWTRKERRLAVAKLQGGFYCYYCQSEKESLSVDHVIPRAAGGSHDLRNLVLACNTCNLLKSSHDVDALLGLGYETLGMRLADIQAERATFGPDEVKHALAQHVEGIDPGYNTFERFLVDIPIAKVIDAALTYAGMSKWQLTKKAKLGHMTLDQIMSGSSGFSVNMLYRLATATGYPITEFLKCHNKWSSPPDTPARELEVLAAKQGLNGHQLSIRCYVTRLPFSGVFREVYYLANALVKPLATLLKVDIGTIRELQQRINLKLLRKRSRTDMRMRHNYYRTPEGFARYASPPNTPHRELEVAAKKQGLSGQALNRACGIHRAYFSEVFRGRTRLKASLIPQLASVLKLDIDTVTAMHQRINAMPVKWKKKA